MSVMYEFGISIAKVFAAGVYNALLASHRISMWSACSICSSIQMFSYVQVTSFVVL